MDLLIALIAAGALIFWFVQFADLMRRSDDDFPERYDKLIWAAILLLANVLGAILFMLCKPIDVPHSSEALRSEPE